MKGKKALYEGIMKEVSKVVKRAIFEADGEDEQPVVDGIRLPKNGEVVPLPYGESLKRRYGCLIKTVTYSGGGEQEYPVVEGYEKTVDWSDEESKRELGEWLLDKTWDFLMEEIDRNFESERSFRNQECELFAIVNGSIFQVYINYDVNYGESYCSYPGTYYQPAEYSTTDSDGCVNRIQVFRDDDDPDKCIDETVYQGRLDFDIEGD